VGLGQCLQAVFPVTQVVTDVRQQGAHIGNHERCPGGP
jgi:hypothetical protein